MLILALSSSYCHSAVKIPPTHSPSLLSASMDLSFDVESILRQCLMVILEIEGGVWQKYKRTLFP